MRELAPVVVRIGAAAYALVAVVVPAVALLAYGGLVYWVIWLLLGV